MRLPPEKIHAWITSNFEVKERKGGEELRICNPFDGDAEFHFNINIQKALCHDWHGDDWAGYSPSGKRAKRTFLKFVQLYLKCSYTHAVREVVGSTSSARAFLRHQRLQKEQEDKKDLSFGLPDGTESILKPKRPRAAASVQKWLHSRGIDDNKIAKYDIQHTGLDAVWPYYEYDELVYWQSRSITDKRFLFPDLAVGVGKGDFFYGFDQVEPASHLIITEAIIDCQTIEEQCLSSSGAILTERQLRKIKLLGPRDGIILAPDNDAAGVDSILRNAQILGVLGYPIFFSIPPQIRYGDNEDDITKDWNDIQVKAKQDAGELLVNGVRRLGITEKLKLRSLLARD